MTDEQQGAIKQLIAKAVAGRVWAAIPELQNKDFATVVTNLVVPITITDADVVEMGKNPNGDHRVARLIASLADQAQTKIIQNFVQQGARPVRR